tara:strand:+ start:93 stop:497 length:405 start_codon:yes stop_codon:yes gene_type:complete
MSNGQKIEDKIMNTFTLGEDYVKTLRMKYPWVERAVSSGLTYEDTKTGKSYTVYSRHEKDPEHGWIVFPTVRRKRKNGKPTKELDKMEMYEAWDMATGRGKYKGRTPDFIPVPSRSAGELLSKTFSKYQGKNKK